MNIPSFYSFARRLLLAALTALCLAFALDGAAVAGMTSGVKSETLPNGLRVLVLENHKAAVATFNIFYKVGSRNETFGRTGISHLCEHLMFDGTRTLKPEQFSNIIQENGGEDNAFTTADYTGYFEIINKKNFEVPIRLEADRMANFDPKGFKAEKQVVMEERRLRTDDNPQAALQEATQAAAFVAHPYHWPVIGWMHDIQGLTLKDALAYHAIYYSPQNAVIVAVGAFNADQVLKEIAAGFGGIKNGPPPPPVTEVEPPQMGERQVVLKHAADVPAFAEAFHVPNWRQTSDAFALEIASEILSDGKSSRLYKDMVVDKHMVVGVGAGYDMTSFDPGLFWVVGTMRPGVATADGLKEANRELAELRDKPVSARELQKAKNLEQAEFVFGQDSILNEAMMLGLYEMLGNYKMLDQYIPNIDKVTAADVQRVARKYLVKDNCTVGVLVPTGVLPHQMGGGIAGGQVRHAAPLAAEGAL